MDFFLIITCITLIIVNTIIFNLKWTYFSIYINIDIAYDIHINYSIYCITDYNIYYCNTANVSRLAIDIQSTYICIDDIQFIYQYLYPIYIILYILLT